MIKKLIAATTGLPLVAAAVIAVAVVSSMVGLTQATPVQAADKVNICHRTNSFNNPYEKISVDESAIDGVGQSDHFGQHTGPVFDPTVHSQQNRGWGDIIPPVLGVHDGLNWTTEGQAIYNNDCKPTVNYCDPTQRPNGKSIGQWLAENKVNGDDCFEYVITQECGYLNVELTQYPIFDGKPYGVVYTTDGTVVYPANSFPAEFDEDENGGSVNVTWYIVGPEKDYLVGFDKPNFWDGKGETVAVDTDCEDEPGRGGVVTTDPKDPTPPAKEEKVAVASLPFTSGNGEAAALISLSAVSVLTIAGALVRRHFGSLSI